MLIGQAPEQWGGGYWGYCPHSDCYWVYRAATLLDAKAALSHHQAEAHR